MLTIPASIQERIDKELATLPELHGKIVLQLIFNCNTSKIIGSLKITRSIEDEIRP